VRPVYVLLVLSAAIAASAQQHSYAISGQVILDNGAPVGNAEINISLHGFDEVLDPVLTDSQGRFSFTSLPAGQFILSAQRNDLGFFFYGQYPQPGVVTEVDLNARYPHKEVVFRIERPAIVEGFVRGPQGNPLPAVQVYSKRRAWVGGKSVTIVDRNVSSDQAGHYRLSVHRGKLRICASLLSGAESVIPIGYATFGEPPREVYTESCQPASPLEALPTQKINLNFVLTSKAPVAVTGTVINGPPNINGYSVRLNARDETNIFLPRVGVETPDTHTFRFANVLPGQYWLSAEVSFNENGVSQSLVARQALNVEPSGASDLKLTLAPPPRINVVIHAPKTADPFDVGLNDLSQPNMTPFMAQHEPDGDLQIHLRYPGKYRLATRSKSDSPACPVAARFGDVDALESDLEIPSGSKQTLEVTATDRCGALKVKVINEAGKPAPGSRILLLLTGTPDDPGDVSYEFAEADGSFEYLGLRPGQYSLWSWDESDEWNGAVEDLSSMAKWRTVVTVKAGEKTVIDLPRMHR